MAALQGKRVICIATGEFKGSRLEIMQESSIWHCLISLLLLISGSLHCVACTDNGEVYTWGDNDEGQLGDGSTNAIQRPRFVAALQVTEKLIQDILIEHYTKLYFRKFRLIYDFR